MQRNGKARAAAQVQGTCVGAEGRWARGVAATVTVVVWLLSLTGQALAQAAIPTLTKSFGATSIPLNGTTTLSFTVTNTSSTDSAANVTFTDSLPAGLVVATPNGLSQSCTDAGPSTIVAVAGSSGVSFVNPVLGISGSGGSCTFTVGVVGTTNGTKTNLVVVSSFGGAGNMASATITVGSLTPPTVSKAFGAASIAVGAATSLTVTIGNSNASSLTGLAFTDSLPAGLVVATPNALTNSCNGSASATAGGGSLSLSGGTMAPSGTCVITINVVATTAGTKTNTIASVTSNEAPPSAAASAGISVNTGSTSTTLTSSLNPSSYSQAVTFTATVTDGGSTPTGTVTFLDGGSAIGTGVLTGGIVTFVTSTLSAGSHSITASYPGSGSFAASVSPTLTQVVGVPADSARLRALQLAVTNVEAHASGAAFEGAVSGAIADGFADSGGALITSTGGGMHINFAAEPQADPRGTAAEFGSNASARESSLRESGLWNGSHPGESFTNTPAGNTRINDTFGTLAYAGNSMPAKAPPLPVRMPQEWQFWADVRGTGWNTDVSAGDIVGGQVNAMLGVTRRLTPDFLIGAVGGYETFNYSSSTLNGRLKGDGWTVGGYLGWRMTPGIRFDAALARSGVNYDGVSGTASATFPGSRWIASAGLTGTYKIALLEIEPSAKVYALWEHDKQYLDSLGTLQSAYDFSSGRASGGAKLAYPWLYGTTVTVAPYVGAYADYYFNNSGSTTPLLPTQFVQGWSARLTAGLNFNVAGGIRGSVGGELGGLGNDFLVWSVRGRASIPFSF